MATWLLICMALHPPAPAAAYPEFWLLHKEAEACNTAHPTMQMNAHGAPQPDS
jgi:hypothetical protein